MMEDIVEAPYFTLVERDRRWGQLRRLMRAADCDCLVAWDLAGDPVQRSARYLAQIGGGTFGTTVVLPLEGEPTAFLTREIGGEAASRARTWITDLRFGDRPEAIAEHLREDGLGEARVGVTSMGNGESSDFAGVAAALERFLPKAVFYTDESLLRTAHLVKGPEEIELIQLVMVANEFAFGTMCSRMQPDGSKDDILKTMTSVLFRAGGGPPAQLVLSFDGMVDPGMALVVPDRIPEGCLCSPEISARIFGYQAESNHTILIGEAPADYPDALRATVDVFDEVRGWARPGVTVREICEYFEVICRAKRLEPAADLLIHANGVYDWPHVGPRSVGGPEGDLELQPGHAFTLKPTVRLASGTATQYGEAITITESGARRLAKRDPAPVVVGRTD